MYTPTLYTHDIHIHYMYIYITILQYIHDITVTLPTSHFAPPGASQAQAARAADAL